MKRQFVGFPVKEMEYCVGIAADTFQFAIPGAGITNAI